MSFRLSVILFLITAVMSAYSCRVPRQFKVEDDVQTGGCGRYSRGVMLNHIQQARYPDTAFILESLDSLDTEQTAALQQIDIDCRTACSLKKEELRNREEELHEYVLNIKKLNKEKNNVYLKELAGRINELENFRFEAVREHRQRYESSLKLLNDEQRTALAAALAREQFTPFP